MPIATTGIAGLDAQLGGGVPRGSTLLLIGEPGNAISLFSEQFAGGGLDVGDDVHYFQVDRPVTGLREAVRAFVVRGNESKAQLTLHDAYSTRFAAPATPRLRDANALPVPPNGLLEAVGEVLAQQAPGRPYRLVLESLSSLARGPQDEARLLQFMETMVHAGHQTGGLHLVSLVKGLHSPAFETHMRHLAGGVIEFGAERKGFGIYNYLVVTKLLGVRDPVKILLWKETDKGLWLESTKRVF